LGRSATDIKQDKAIFIKITELTFIDQDERFLSGQFDLKSFRFGVRRGFRHVIKQVQMLFWLLLNVPGAAVLYVWFCDYHTLLPVLVARLFGVKSVVVIGGYDAAYRPDLNYGAHVRWLRGKIVRWSCRLTDQLLPVSNHTEASLAQILGDWTLSRSNVIYNGVDLAIFSPPDEPGDRTGVICVSTCNDIRTAKTKGLDVLVAAAARLPDISFRIVGLGEIAIEWLSARAGSNMTLEGKVPQSALLDYFRRAKVVCQVSRSESFGLALAEGMACGCVPVATRETGMEELLMDNIGFLADQEDIDSIVDALQRANEAPDMQGSAAAQRIQDRFSLASRLDQIDALCTELATRS